MKARRREALLELLKAAPLVLLCLSLRANALELILGLAGAAILEAVIVARFNAKAAKLEKPIKATENAELKERVKILSRKLNIKEPLVVSVGENWPQVSFVKACSLNIKAGKNPRLQVGRLVPLGLSGQELDAALLHELGHQANLTLPVRALQRGRLLLWNWALVLTAILALHPLRILTPWALLIPFSLIITVVFERESIKLSEINADLVALETLDEPYHAAGALVTFRRCINLAADLEIKIRKGLLSAEEALQQIALNSRVKTREEIIEHLDDATIEARQNGEKHPSDWSRAWRALEYQK